MSSRKKLKMVASNIEVAAGFPAAPDPEVRAVAKRRQFSAAYKLAVLTEAERLTEHGAIRGAATARGAVQLAPVGVAARARGQAPWEALGRRRGAAKHARRRRSGASSGCKRAACAWSASSSKRGRSSGSKKNSVRCWDCPRRRAPRAPRPTPERGGRTRAAESATRHALRALGGSHATVVSAATRCAWCVRGRDASRHLRSRLPSAARSSKCSTAGRFADATPLHRVCAVAR